MVSIFEIIMLVCFGLAWPFSIHKSLKTKNVTGKSGKFILIVFIGYVAGFIHKVLYNFDYVAYLYALNAIMVFTDLMLYYKIRKINKKLK